MNWVIFLDFVILIVVILGSLAIAKMFSELEERIEALEKANKKNDGAIDGAHEDVKSLERKLRELKSDIDILRPICVSYHISMEKEKRQREPKTDAFWDYPRSMQENILATRLEGEHLRVRSFLLLKAADIDTVGQLCSVSEKDLRRFRNAGKKTIEDVSSYLDQYGLRLGMDLSDFGYDPYPSEAK